MAIIAIAAYSGFVFMFYRLLARRDILTLDLSKYNHSKSGRIRAFFSTGIWLLKYALMIPVLIAFWTLVMAVILTLLADGNDHTRNALIATSVVGSVRILSYWTEDLSRDVAKMLPFAVLGVFLVDSTSVQWSQFEDLVGNLPGLAESFYTSMALLVILETLLRISHSLGNRLYPIPELESTFKDADADGDGKLSIEEFTAVQTDEPPPESPDGFIGDP